jgi:quercetin dioxygenase-like cupin family protein
MRRALTLLGAAVVFASPALAQDAAKVDAKHYKVVAENERVRVLAANVEAGDKGVMHEHPANFVVFVTDAKVRFTLGDGTTTPEATRKAGDVMTGEAVKHQPENLGGAFKAYVIEVKPGAPAPAPVPGAVPAPSGPKMSRTPIVSGPHGEAVRTKVEAGYEEPAGSKHDYDAVVVPMTETGSTLTMDGKTVTMKKGQAYLISRGVAHSVKATAAGESVVIYIK